MTFASQINPFWLFGNALGDKYKIPKENFGLGRPRFHVTSHIKIEAKVFFS